MSKYTPLDRKETKTQLMAGMKILFEAMENVIEAHETWLTDAADWTERNSLTPLSRSWLDESLGEGKEAIKNLKRYKIFREST
jgi:hypothetical protein